MLSRGSERKRSSVTNMGDVANSNAGLWYGTCNVGHDVTVAGG